MCSNVIEKIDFYFKFSLFLEIKFSVVLNDGNSCASSKAEFLRKRHTVVKRFSLSDPKSIMVICCSNLLFAVFWMDACLEQSIKIMIAYTIKPV